MERRAKPSVLAGKLKALEGVKLRRERPLGVPSNNKKMPRSPIKLQKGPGWRVGTGPWEKAFRETHKYRGIDMAR